MHPHATFAKPLLQTLITVLILTSLGSSLQTQASDVNCCHLSSTPSYNAQVVECPNISTNASVACVHDFLQSTSESIPLPLDIRISYSDVDLLPDDFFAEFQVAGLEFSFCGLKEVPYRLLAPICDKMGNSLLLYDNDIASLDDNGFSNCHQLTSLDLNSNSLSEVHPAAFNGLDKLQALYLQYNKIKTVAGFGSLPALQIILLDTNEIISVDVNAFGELHILEILNIGTNFITTLVDGTFDSLTALNALQLGGNPFNCNCSLQWLQEWIEYYGMGTDARCATPVNEYVVDAEFQCSTGTTTELTTSSPEPGK